MAKVKALTWMEIAGTALVGGLGYGVYRGRTSSLQDKVKVGDVVSVPLDAIALTDPSQAAALNVPSLAGVAGRAAVTVTAVNVAREHFWSPNTGTALGVTGQSVGLRVPVSFPLGSVSAIARDGRAVT